MIPKRPRAGHVPSAVRRGRAVVVDAVLVPSGGVPRGEALRELELALLLALLLPKRLLHLEDLVVLGAC